MLLLTRLPAVLAVLISVGLLELICTSRASEHIGFGPPQKVVLVLMFIVTLLIWLFVSGRKTRNDEEREEARE